MALSPEQIAALFALQHQDDVPGPQMGVGTGFGGAPLSQLLNPAKRGRFRVGALGTSGTSISPSILKALFPIMQSRRQEADRAAAGRMSDAEFAASLRDLSPDQQREAIFQRKNPKYFDVLEGRAKERRGMEAERAKNARELDEARTKAGETEKTLRSRMEFSSDLIRKRGNANDMERFELLKKALKPLGEADADVAAHAAQLGRTLPAGAMYLQTPEDKKLYEELAGGGMPDQSIVTGEDVAEIEQQFQQYETARAAIPQNEERGDASFDITERTMGLPTRFRFTPGELIKTDEDRKKFDELVKIHAGEKNPVAAAWAEFKGDAKEAYQKEKDATTVERTETNLANKTDQDLEMDHIAAESKWMAAKDARERAEGDAMTTSGEKAKLSMAEKEAYNTKLRIEEIQRRRRGGGGSAGMKDTEISQPIAEPAPDVAGSEMDQYISLVEKQASGAALTEEENAFLDAVDAKSRTK